MTRGCLKREATDPDGLETYRRAAAVGAQSWPGGSKLMSAVADSDHTQSKPKVGGFEYGVLLPHFGAHSNRERLIQGAQQIEAYGFDSVWVRDHVVYEPHAHEDPNRTHLEPFVTLGAVASVTSRVKLATGVMIPHRNPIYAALLIASLDFIAGSGRVEIGFGLGAFDHEFEAVGMGGLDRREVLREQVQVFRQLWAGGNVDHHGRHYQFSQVQIRPVPEAGDIPVWYGGNSMAAARRAVEFCDGWIAGRIPRRLYARRVEKIRRLSQELGRPMLKTGTIPYVSPGRTMEEAVKHLNVPQLLEDVNARYRSAGSYQSLDDLGGFAIAGPPDKLIEEVRLDQQAGAQHFIFDLRARFADWEDCLGMIGEEILPELREGDRAAG